jgi:thioredoxin 1
MSLRLQFLEVFLMIKVTLVHASWCTVCPDARRLWTELKSQYNFDYKEVDVESPEGQALINKYGIVGVPTTIIDGKVAFTGLLKKADAIARISEPDP